MMICPGIGTERATIIRPEAVDLDLIQRIIFPQQRDERIHHLRESRSAADIMIVQMGHAAHMIAQTLKAHRPHQRIKPADLLIARVADHRAQRDHLLHVAAVDADRIKFIVDICSFLPKIKKYSLQRRANCYIIGMMTGLVTVEPPGCDACYECLAPGNIKDQEIKLSCTNHPRTVQPQVIPFSSTVAGFASQCAMHMLIGGFPYTRSGQSNKAWSYMINEMGYGDTEVAMRVLMSAPDPHCGFHRMLADSHDVKLVSIAIARDDDVRTIWRKISDVLGIDTQFILDFVDDRLFYLAFPEGETGSEHRTPPIMSLMLDDRDTDDIDALTIARMPVDHVYYVRDACDIDGRRWPVRISFRRDAS